MAAGDRRELLVGDSSRYGPAVGCPLVDYQEIITVTGWPAGNGTVLRVAKVPKEAARITAQSGDLANERLLKIVVQLKWDGPNGIAHTRELATILSNGGISRVTLPAMGPIGGGAWDAATDETPIAEQSSDGSNSGDSGDDSTGASNGNGVGSSGWSGTENGNSGGGNSGTNSDGGSGSNINGNGKSDSVDTSNAGGKGRGNVGGASGVK